jgi:putative molybdopterin biosynthesis protein
MGIYAAAKALGLEFIPVTTERYDLVIPTVHFDSSLLQTLLEVIATREFKDQVLALGGYDVRDTGRIMARFMEGEEVSQ